MDNGSKPQIRTRPDCGNNDKSVLGLARDHDICNALSRFAPELRASFAFVFPSPFVSMFLPSKEIVASTHGRRSIKIFANLPAGPLDAFPKVCTVCVRTVLHETVNQMATLV